MKMFAFVNSKKYCAQAPKHNCNSLSEKMQDANRQTIFGRFLYYALAVAFLVQLSFAEPVMVVVNLQGENWIIHSMQTARKTILKVGDVLPAPFRLKANSATGSIKLQLTDATAYMQLQGATLEQFGTMQRLLAGRADLQIASHAKNSFAIEAGHLLFFVKPGSRLNLQWQSDNTLLWNCEQGSVEVQDQKSGSRWLEQAKVEDKP